MNQIYNEPAPWVEQGISRVRIWRCTISAIPAFFTGGGTRISTSTAFRPPDLESGALALCDSSRYRKSGDLNAETLAGTSSPGSPLTISVDFLKKFGGRGTRIPRALRLPLSRRTRYQLRFSPPYIIKPSARVELATLSLPRIRSTS